jgi:hypothetical protein
MSSTLSAATLTSGTSSFDPLYSAPSPGQIRGHIGDLLLRVLERMLVDNLLEEGELPAVSYFVFAAPIHAAKAIRTILPSLHILRR